MIEVLQKSHDNILGIKGTGKITASDYETFLIPRLNKLIEEYGKGRFLYYLPEDFEGFELGAMWDDAKYLAGHNDKFEKVALVGGPKWVEWTTKVAKYIVNAEVKTFSINELDNAWQWLEENASEVPPCQTSGTSEHGRLYNEDEPCKEQNE